VSDTLTITPSVIIRRAKSRERGIEVLDVPHEESGERALLVFASPEIAETFRASTQRRKATGSCHPCGAAARGPLGWEL
jgi:hypothetical protein